jgi:hypothetical protein
MMKRKMIQEAALDVHRDLLEAERNCDGMIANLAGIALTLTRTREAAGLSIHHGQDSLARVAESFAAVTAARGEMIRLHDGLAAENTSLGAPLKLTGDVGKPTQIVPEMLIRAA